MAYTVEQFLKIIQPMAQEDMKKTGLLASLTMAQALLESKYGNSGLTTTANNLFGMKGNYKGKSVTLPTTEYEEGMRKTILAVFRKYPSWAESIADHSQLIVSAKRYEKVIGAQDYKEACRAIQDAGYATDPDYATKLIFVIEKYNLYNFDNPQDIGTKRIKILLNGIEKEVETINLDGFNYIKLRDLVDEKIKVDYDAVRKLPVVEVK